jgi:hypothetical protein
MEGGCRVFLYLTFTADGMTQQEPVDLSGGGLIRSYGRWESLSRFYYYIAQCQIQRCAEPAQGQPIYCFQAGTKGQNCKPARSDYTIIPGEQLLSHYGLVPPLLVPFARFDNQVTLGRVNDSCYWLWRVDWENYLEVRGGQS